MCTFAPEKVAVFVKYVDSSGNEPDGTIDHIDAFPTYPDVPCNKCGDYYYEDYINADTLCYQFYNPTGRYDDTSICTVDEDAPQTKCPPFPNGTPQQTKSRFSKTLSRSNPDPDSNNTNPIFIIISIIVLIVLIYLIFNKNPKKLLFGKRN